MSAAQERPPWLVSVRRSRDENPVGAGMLVTPRHILTCAHVVRTGTALGVPEEPVFVQFQYAPEHEPVPATVVPGGWHPASGADTGDVAVLELGAPAPAQAAPAPLRTTDPGTWDHRFRAYGYPREHPRQGVPVRGEIIGHAGGEWLQVEASPQTGWGLEQGFSGSPVWDMNSQGVIGMLVARDSVTKIDRRTAYAIKVETLVRYWPELAPYVRDATTQELRARLESLLWIPLTEGGEIPRVDQVDPHDIGVSRSKYSDRPDGAPYVPRHPQDDLLDAAVAGSRFVLLAGRSKAGKSRTLFEALRRTLPGARLIVPRPDSPDRRVLDDLSRLHLPTGQDRAVLWLDDLHHFLQPGGVDLQILDRLARRQPAVTVVATIPAKQRAALTGMENDVGRIARTVLGKARAIELPPLLTPEDAVVAREFYPTEDFASRGIGELMVAAPGLEQRFNDGAESCPEGWAVVKATTDWHRMGMIGPLPAAVLRDLFDSYLTEHHPQLDADEDRYRSGLAWAREPVAGGIALVRQVRGPDGDSGYAGFPYMSEYLDTRADDPSARVPRFAWEYLSGPRPSSELLAIAYTALVREESDIAEQMLLRISRTPGDQDSSAWASLMLGEIRLYQGDFGAAVTLLDDAASSGAESVVPLAQVELAGALMVTGDRARARGLLENAMNSKDPQASQMSQVALAGLLVAQGESERAQQLLEAVMESGDAEVAPLAKAQLGRMLTEGDPSGTRTGRKPGAERGKPGTGAGAARGGPVEPLEQPWTLSRAVGESITGQITALARANLGGLLANQGNLDRAEELLRSVVESGQFHAAPLAQVSLGELLILRGLYDDAREMLEAVLRTGHPLVTPVAQVTLAIVLLEQEETARGLALLREVALSDHPDQAPRAACVLGEWFGVQEDADAAGEWLGRAVSSGHPDWSIAAQVDLAVLLLADDEEGTARARELLAEAAGCGHPEQSPRAADFLGDLLARDGHIEAAENAYRIAIDSGHRLWSLLARIDLALLLADDEEGTARARELLAEAAGCGHPEQSPRAADFLGDLLARDGHIEAAENAYRIAIDSGHQEWSLVARIDLAVMLAGEGSFARAESLLRVVADSDNLAAATWASALLGLVLVYSGERAAGLAYLRTAGDADSAPASQLARFHLAKCLVEDGDESGAEELLQVVIQDEQSDVTAVAQAYLGVLRLRRGDAEAAEELLVGAEASGDSEAIAVAYLGRGEHLLEVGEVQVAGDLLEAALAAGDAETAPRAAALLGVVRRSTNDLEEARQLLTDALAADDPTIEPMARRYLGSTLFRLGLLTEAEEALLPLALSDDIQHRPRALLVLGQVLATAGRTEDAYPWFEQAIASGDQETEADARYDFAELLMRAGLRERAAAVLAPLGADEETAAGTPDSATPVAPRPQGPAPHPLPAAVLTLLGDVAGAEGDPAEARYWYDLAARAAATSRAGPR
ncbi:tetratricopeptide repeat protein [Streptomyces sp. NPDC023998]|uniref:tetratricopeptide repeat protein n=1 Tax=Streptomyces sp. NPDC023998 TaxID=3154597 RepID=UPI00340EA86A